MNERALSAEAVARLTVDTEPFLSCDECFDRVDVHVETVLAGGRPEPAMEAHLRGCPACAEEAQALLDLLRDEG